jgi:hypothetical protein
MPEAVATCCSANQEIAAFAGFTGPGAITTCNDLGRGSATHAIPGERQGAGPVTVSPLLRLDRPAEVRQHRQHDAFPLSRPPCQRTAILTGSTCRSRLMVWAVG